MIKNIYYMLAYVYAPLWQGGYESVEKEEFEHIHNLFAAILSRGIGRLLKQGLYREYVERREDLPALRGRVDLQGTVQNVLARKRVISCGFDELSENNRMNQIIKTTAMLLLGHRDVSAGHKSELKKEMLFFSGVDLIDPASIKWQTIRFQRNNHTYRMLAGICQLILEGMLLTTDSGGYRLASLIRPKQMNRLYERFLLAYYSREHPELQVGASRIPWALDDGPGTMLPTMQSDVTLSNKDGDRVLIIDAKYYASTTQSYYDVRTVHSGNLYQIFTYVKNKDAALGGGRHVVAGLLLYARTEEEIQPDHSYRMSGNAISVRTLDLNRKFSEIAAQLDSIADDFFGSFERAEPVS